MSRFSNWTREVGVISYLRRPFKMNKPKTVTCTTTVAVRQDAEILINFLRSSNDQHSRMKLQASVIRSRNPSHRAKPLLRLNPFIDDWLENSTLPFDVKHPIILPRRSQVTKLITDHFFTRGSSIKERE